MHPSRPRQACRCRYVCIDRLVKILDSLDPEDAADALDELPDEVEARVLPRLRESQTVGELQSYKEDSAGGIMTRKLVAVPPTWSVGQVVSEIRRRADLIKKIDSASQKGDIFTKSLDKKTFTTIRKLVCGW